MLAFLPSRCGGLVHQSPVIEAYMLFNINKHRVRLVRSCDEMTFMQVDFLLFYEGYSHKPDKTVLKLGHGYAIISIVLYCCTTAARLPQK